MAESTAILEDPLHEASPEQIQDLPPEGAESPDQKKGKDIYRMIVELAESAMSEKHASATDYVKSDDVQAKIDGIFSGLDSLDTTAMADLREYVELHAIAQHMDNPEQYVSHGFDHSLNVMKYMNKAIDGNPQIAETMMTTYHLNEGQAKMMLRLVAIFHDFGYPDLGDKGKALHAVIGAEIAAHPRLREIMNKLIPLKESDFQDLMFDFKNAILYHSADKVEIYRDAKIKIAHGEFIIDAENVVDVYNSLSAETGQSRMEIVCAEEVEQKMKTSLQKAGISMDAFVFHRPQESDLNAEGRFQGRAVDLNEKKDKLLGIQFKPVSLAEDPMNFMIRLTDNCDLTIDRFSPLQQSKVFQEIYNSLGAFDGQNPPTGHLMLALEKCRDGKKKLGEVLANPTYQLILETLDVSVSGSMDQKMIEKLIEDFKSKLIDDILSEERFADDLKQFSPADLKRLGMYLSSDSVNHFGGCECCKDVDLCHGEHVTITVDRARFEELNKTKIAETVYTADGHKSEITMGIGMYQIWRAHEAYRSLETPGGGITIVVVDESGAPLIENFSEFMASQ